jgi:HSP20 family protein
MTQKLLWHGFVSYSTLKHTLKTFIGDYTMGIIRVDPFRGIDGMMRRMTDVLEDINRGGVRFEVGDFTPRVDISEDEKNLSFQAELPGLSKEDVKVTLVDNVLTIRGEKKREEKQEDKNFMRIERSFGSFTRSFNLPEVVEPDAINAQFNNGVLNITIPKKEPVKPKELEVEIR